MKPAFSHRPAPGVDVSHDIILYVEGLTVSFDGFRALDNLNLYIRDGELRCLIGANGAGKTTLMDVITGRTACDSGSVFFGQTYNLLNFTEPQIAALGIGRKFQKPTVLEKLTVFENLALAVKANKRVWPMLTASITAEDEDLIDKVLGQIALREQAYMQTGQLAHGQKQWMEIGMLLASQPRLLLIDEPVAGMTAAETDRTAELLLELQGEHTVIVVEHDMEFVRSIANTVTVLHQGSVLMEGTMDEVQRDQSVVAVYLGEEQAA